MEWSFNIFFSKYHTRAFINQVSNSEKKQKGCSKNEKSNTK